MSGLVPDADVKLAKWGYDADGRSLLEMGALFQENHKPHLEDLCHGIHGRALKIDGDIGPATAHVMNTRFCSCPDTMPNAAAEEANWPTSCRDDLRFSWNFDRMPGLTEAETDGMWQGTKDEYERLFEIGIRLAKDEYPNTELYASLKQLFGPTLAWSELARNRCGIRLEEAYDNTIQWSVKLAEGTNKHEVGHFFGMMHTPNDPRSLMYPSMNGQTGLNATDIAQMIRLGYKRRTSPPDTGWGMF